MRRDSRHRRLVRIVVLGALLGIIAASADSYAYTKLQVLLPGESPAPGTATGKIGVPRAQTVGLPFNVLVRACDDTWNTDATVTNLVRLGSTDESATLPAPTMLVAGELHLAVVMNAAGSFTVSAKDESDPTIPEAVSSVVRVYAINGFEFSRISQKNQYAGQPMPITLYAVDGNGSVVTGFSGPVLLKEITSFGEGRISPQVVTLSGGQWSGNVTMYRADETSVNRGNVNIYAFLEADPSKNGTSDPFTVHPGSFARVQAVLPGQSPLPGSVSGVSGSPATQSAGQGFWVDVYATDTYWNPVPSFDTVRLTSSDPAASTPVSGALTEGFRRFTVSLGTVGTQTISVSDQTNGSIQGMTTAGIQVIPNAAHHFTISPVPSPLTAGEPVTVTIRAVDVTGNTIPGYEGNAILSANTGPGSISPEAIVFADGQWTGQMVFRGAGGAVSFSCYDFSSPPHMGTSNSFEVLAGPYVGLQVLLPGQSPRGGTSSGYEGSPDDQNAGAAFILTVRAVDAFWNRVPGVNNPISLLSSDAFADMPEDTVLQNGELALPVRLFRVGYQTITASDPASADIEPHTSTPVHVLPGPYARIVIIAPGQAVAPGSEEGRTGEATDQSITYSFTVTVYATDAWFNPVGGVTDVIRITSNDPLAELPQDAAMADGRADFSVRLSTGGYQQITASNVTQPAMPPSTTQVRAISSGLHLEAEVSPTVVKAGELFDLTVKVTNDAGSVIQEINSSVTVEVQNAATQEPGRGILENTEFQILQGQRTMPETYTFAERIVLVIHDDLGNTPAVTEVITVLPGDPAAVTLTSDPPWVRGNKHATVYAKVADQFDNGVPGESVLFELLSGMGVLTPIDTATADDGVCRADFLSPREPEIARIRATSGGLAAEMDLETALVDPNSPGGTVTNYPNPFHPDEAPTTIAYKLSDNAQVKLRIYTLTGGLVLEKIYEAGAQGGLVGLNEVLWDGRNGENEMVASGGYILDIEAKGNGETIHTMRRKIAVVR